MKFIIDAQLPYGIKQFIESEGYDCLHTNDLPKKGYTLDNEILNISLKEERIIVTKDKDFLDSFMINGLPKKLILITTGNVSNRILFNLIIQNFAKICELLETNNLLVLNTKGISGS